MNLLEVLGKGPIGCTGRTGLELGVVTYRDLAACILFSPTTVELLKFLEELGSVIPCYTPWLYSAWNKKA